MVSEPAHQKVIFATAKVPHTPAEMTAKTATKALKIGWIGAGSINFGSLEGPWNHAARLQKQKGVQFTAIVEPNLDLARVLSALFFSFAGRTLTPASPSATLLKPAACCAAEKS